MKRSLSPSPSSSTDRPPLVYTRTTNLICGLNSTATTAGWRSVVEWLSPEERLSSTSLVCAALLEASNACYRSAYFDRAALSTQGSNTVTLDRLRATYARFPALGDVTVSIRGEQQAVHVTCTTHFSSLTHACSHTPLSPSHHPEHTHTGGRERGPLNESVPPTSLTILPAQLSLLASSTFANIVTLRLVSCSLGELPSSIGEMRQLTDLDVSNNKLKTLPREIGEMRDLTRLHVGFNSIEALPDSIGQLAKLERLLVYYNKLSGLPESIGHLVNLTDLLAHGNHISSLPRTIGNLASLKRLLLIGNKLTTLPRTFGKLTNLEVLELGMNELTSLPDSVCALSSLVILNLQNNGLVALPAKIGALSQLRDLLLDDNLLVTLPATVVALTEIAFLQLDVLGAVQSDAVQAWCDKEREESVDY